MNSLRHHPRARKFKTCTYCDMSTATESKTLYYLKKYEYNSDKLENIWLTGLMSSFAVSMLTVWYECYSIDILYKMEIHKSKSIECTIKLYKKVKSINSNVAFCRSANCKYCYFLHRQETEVQTKLKTSWKKSMIAEFSYKISRSL